ncbi:MAG: hypothetical protein A2X94_10625 [Bdellovibrionales bacterium GWB1_55_8]|nr:MAG: hypothetical protein A2X94_10625 [Bdellovibrionales bacterium GWB1_55_8]
MFKFTEKNAECLIFTLKEGVFSSMAHDLKLQVKRFEIEVDHPHAIRAMFDARSITLVSALKDGEEQPLALKEKDRVQINENLQHQVLETAHFPTIRFQSSEVTTETHGYKVKGQLELKGQRQPIGFSITEHARAYSSEIILNQKDFGIQPFSALMGAIRVRPDVRIRISVADVGLPST